MIETQENSEKAIRYLYGELDEATRDALEERLFADEEFSLFLDAVEHDLIDDYVRGEMSAAARRKFEGKYLISETRREKVRAAGILQTELFAEEEETVPVEAAPKTSYRQSLTELFRFPNLAWASALGVILLLILIGGWLFLRQDKNEFVLDNEDSNRLGNLPTPAPTALRSPDEIPPRNNEANENDQPANTQRKTPATKPSPAGSESQKPEKRETVAPEPKRVFAFTLLPIMRSGERPVLIVPPATETVSLRVVHDNEQAFVQYRAEIRDQNGDLIWSREIPVTQKTLARPIVLNVRSAALQSGSYELTLSGMTADKRLEEIKFYNFTVRKK